MPRHTHGPVFSDNPDFDFEIRVVLGASVEAAADPGEVFAATAGIRKGDHDGWFAAWQGLGQRSLDAAEKSAAAGHRVTAAAAYLRASTYFGVAVNAISALADITALVPTFHLQRGAWNGFIEHTDADVERLDIPFEQTTLPGYFFRPAASTKGAVKRETAAHENAATETAATETAATETAATLVVVNGSDGSLASLWAMCVSAALRRGYNVLVFDGPGQQSQLFDAGTTFRPDGEAVLTPVYDAISGRPDVDPARIALYGVSQGGYWVPRALAFEHRYAAAIVDPGVVDVASSWMRNIPKSLVKMLDAGQTEKFDRDMAIGMKLSPETAHTWRFRARPYGTEGYAETLEAVRAYALRDAAASITTPMLITSPEDEQFWPGQSEELARLAPTVSTVMPFTAAEGAGGHCEPLARGLVAGRVFDWLDERLAGQKRG